MLLVFITVALFSIYSIENQLEKMEKKHDIVTRWKTSDSQYVEMKMQLLTERKLRVRNAL